MSKKFKKSLEALNADQVTEMLGDMRENIDRVRKKGGTVRTAFEAVRTMQRLGDLADAAAEKNNVKFEFKRNTGDADWHVLNAIAPL